MHYLKRRPGASGLLEAFRRQHFNSGTHPSKAHKNKVEEGGGKIQAMSDFEVSSVTHTVLSART